jgi:hypothetical protein
MDRVLKGLQGKTLTKKGIFDFLADIDLDVLTGKKENTAPLPPQVIVENPLGVLGCSGPSQKEAPLIKCDSCSRTFTATTSLTRHYKRYPACVSLKKQARNDAEVKLPEDQGLHLFIDDLLTKAITGDTEFECKYCKKKQTNTSNLHRHFNTAVACNRLAFLEFRDLINRV